MRAQIAKPSRDKKLVPLVGSSAQIRRLTPMRAIRKKCLDCCCNQRVEVRECQALDCPLWIYRSGKRPKE